METGSTPTPAAMGEGTLTRQIARTENLVRLFQIDTTLELLQEVDRYVGDERATTLLKYWRAQREHLAKLVDAPEARDSLPVGFAMLPNDGHPGPRCSCHECLRCYPT